MRVLLALVLLVGTLLGWLGIRVKRIRQQQRIVARFDEYNPYAEYRDGYVVKLVFPWDPFASRGGPNDEELVDVKGFIRLEYLDLNSSNLTDAGLFSIKDVKTLKTLRLCDTAITDSGLEQLETLTDLEHLSIVGCDVSEAGVAQLRGALPNCRIVGPSPPLWD